MKPLRRPARSVLTCLLVTTGLLLLGACGTQRAADTAGSDVTPTVRWGDAAPIRVTAARLAEDGRTLSVDAEVPDGPRPCVRGLGARVTDTSSSTVWVQVTYKSPAQDRSYGCTRTALVTARVRLAQPLGRRDVSVNSFTAFTVDGATAPALRLCGENGCHPAPTGCTPDSYDQAVNALDVPNHTSRGTEHCDGTWLVFDTSSPMGPACAEGEGPGCGASHRDRWFFHATPAGWDPIARSTEAGCTGVHRTEPAFPTALCAHLPALT
ncbi:hypothetical protein ACGF7W_26290 [Streptomyces sp. NPDC048219]|uniref:hypothetical protein n=1 Tax=Streptomyces sp. NPDC048219 TaxID=3365517 RepID=UPI00371C57DD